jgi:hypothetical protein
MLRTVIMTRAAVAGDARMGERVRFKPAHCMTHVTILRRWQVIYRFPVEPVSGRAELAIVATFATTGNACMNREQENRRLEDQC